MMQISKEMSAAAPQALALAQTQSPAASPLNELQQPRRSKDSEAEISEQAKAFMGALAQAAGAQSASTAAQPQSQPQEQVKVQGKGQALAQPQAAVESQVPGQVQLTGQAQAQSQAAALTQTMPQAGSPLLEGTMNKGPVAGKAMLGSSSVPASALRSPATLQTAVGANTAATIAGLKPWSASWVNSGGPESNPELKPLFGEASAEKPLRGDVPVTADLSELSQALQAVGGAVEAVSAEAGTPQASLANPKPNASKGIASHLSGGEFLKLLNGTRQDLSQGPQAVTSKPELQLIEGGQGQAGLKAETLLERAPMKGPKPLNGAGYQEQSPVVVPQMQPSGLQQSAADAGSQQSASSEVTGHVVKGAMSQDRLATTALIGISSQVKALGQNGGGEIRVRLKPENLGELHLRVVTQGNQVGLQIQASDDKAKRILEESLSSLKESLASQSLTLGKVEFSVAQAVGSAGSASQSQLENGDPQQHSHSGMLSQWEGGAANQQSGRRGSSQGGSGAEINDAQGRQSRVVGGSGAMSAQSAMSSRTARMAGGGPSGRLDVMA